MAFDPEVPARERTAFGNFELNPTHLKSGVTRTSYLDERVPEETKQAARIAVCANASDAADARALLEQLGLIEEAL